MEPLLEISVLIVGLAAGFIGALLGIGGGVIIVPSLSLFLGMPIHSAIAVSIVSVVATGIGGASRYVRKGIINLKLGIFLEATTVLGVIVGVFSALFVSGGILYIIFSILLFYLSFSHATTIKKEEKKLNEKSFIEGQDVISKSLGLEGSYYDGERKTEIYYKVKGSFKGSLMSFFAGIGSGLLGIGGGVFKVTAMNLFMNVPLKVAVATSKFMISVTAAVGSLLYYLEGVTPLPYVAPCALGTMVGASLGARIMVRLRSRYIKAFLAILMAYLGYTMLMKGATLLLGD